jgi:HAD superfamily hydrolase (TIGR01509 family)
MDSGMTRSSIFPRSSKLSPSSLLRKNRDTATEAPPSDSFLIGVRSESPTVESNYRVTNSSPAGLIFDMDGVLIDSEPLHKRAKELAFSEFGIVLPEAVYDSYKGRPDATMLPEILTARGWSAERIHELSRRKRQIYEEIEQELQAIEGAVDFVRWASTRYKIALATSATARNREATFRLLRIGDLFHAVVDASGHQRPKPDPEVFLIAIEKLQLKASNCWIVEDSVNGLKAAKAAGCFAAAITTTFDRQTLSQAGADVIVQSFAELRTLLGSP